MITSLGFDKPLYILSFDNRDVLHALSESDDMLTAEQQAEIASARSQIVSAKHIVYEGFKTALAAGVPKEKAGILADEQFCADILRNAAKQGYLIACPAEKVGQEEFDFEYGEDFAAHIEAYQPAFCKVLVRYNPKGDQDLNRRQSGRLKRLSDYLHRESRSLLMVELLIPPHQAQLEKLADDHETSHAEIRPLLTVEAIRQLQDAQVEPDVWRIEGLDQREDCEKVVAAARFGGRDKVSCMVRGSGSQEKVRGWLKTAAGVQGVIGFAMGPMIFSDPLVQWTSGRTTAKTAAVAIGRRFREFVNIFENDR